MGHQTSHDLPSTASLPTPSKIITDIYNNFTISNKVILHSLPSKHPSTHNNKKRAQINQLM